MYTERKTLKSPAERPDETGKCYNSTEYKRQQQAILFLEDRLLYHFPKNHSRDDELPGRGKEKKSEPEANFSV